MSWIDVFDSETTAVWTQNGSMTAVNLFQSTNPLVFGSALGGVEEALRTAHILEATGWILKYSNTEYCDPCELTRSFTLYPTIGEGALTSTDERLQMSVVPDCSCCMCSSQRKNGWRTYSIQEAGVELISFRYRPRIYHCSGYKNQRSVDIFIPQRSERIGCIEMTGDFKEGTTITDYTTGSVFVVSKSIDDGELELMSAGISNNVGNLAVICQGINGYVYHDHGSSGGGGSEMLWHEFAMEYLPSMANTTLATRAALVVAFHMFVLVHKEKRSRCVTTTMITLFIYTVAFVLGIFLMVYILVNKPLPKNDND